MLSLVPSLAPKQLEYRPELDGLRAISVLAVMLYHVKDVLGGGWFAGGFVGVDVFFVISGYLISKMVFQELESTKHFRFLAFYERRARRILPVQILVLTTSVPLACLLLQPSALVEFAQSVLTTLSFGSNFFFYFSTTEYGAESSLLKPLLHTWSLGVEEQFYLAFPILAVSMMKLPREYRATALGVLTLCSFTYCIVVAQGDRSLAFFNPLTRLWEISFGGILLFVERLLSRWKSRSVGSLLSLFGLVAVSYSALYFGEDTSHPGLPTLIPVLGAGLFIVFSSQDNLIGRALSIPPLRFIGLISFSLYLWHFPVLAYIRLYSLYEAPGSLLVGVAATFALSTVSFYTVEKKFRDSQAISRFTFLLWVGTSTAFLCLVSGGILWKNGDLGWAERSPAFLSQYVFDNNRLRLETQGKLGKRYRIEFEGKSGPKVLIVGNSHAKDLYNLFDSNRTHFSTLNFAYSWIQLACFASDHSRVRRFFESQRYRQSTVVLISSLYSYRTCEKGKGKKAHDLNGVRELTARAKSDGKIVGIIGRGFLFPSRGHRNISDYFVKQANIRFPGQVDQLYDKIETTMYKNRKPAPTITEALMKIARESDSTYLDRNVLMCDTPSQRCAGLTPEGAKIFYDYHHWTLLGAAYLGKRAIELDWFGPILRKIAEKQRLHSD